MIFIIKKKPILSTILLAILSIIISGYFLRQAFTGNYSIQTIKEKETEFQNLVQKYEENNAQINHYKKRIEALNPERIDLDILEEEMKKRTNITQENEIIILLPKKP